MYYYGSSVRDISIPFDIKIPIAHKTSFAIQKFTMYKWESNVCTRPFFIWALKYNTKNTSILWAFYLVKSVITHVVVVEVVVVVVEVVVGSVVVVVVVDLKFIKFDIYFH